MALEDVRQIYDGLIEFSFVFRDGGNVCGPAVVGVEAADVYHNDAPTVFIGPGCSLAVEPLSYMAAKWNIPVITPAGSAGILADKTLFKTLTRLSFGMQEYAEMYLYVLNMYGWKHVALVYDKDDVFSGIIGATFYNIFISTDLALAHHPVRSRSFGDGEYREVLRKANQEARVFIVLAAPDTTRKLLLHAHALGYTTGQHVFLSTIPVDKKLDIWQRSDEHDEVEWLKEVVKEACQSVMFIALSESFDLEYVTFKRNIVNRALRDYNLDFGTTEPTILLTGFYDAIVIYAAVINETLAQGGDPTDGIGVTRRMWNRTFNGIGGRVSINDNGDKYTDFNLFDMQDTANGMFEVVGEYDGQTKTFNFRPGMSVKWVGSGPPPDVPECGFREDRCSGILVRLKRLHIKDILQINKKMLQEFKMIRDINHANLARLCGACLDAHSKVLVGEYCPKGTLQDLLGNPQIKLDAQFKFSLAIDIVQGMCFLHDSHLRHHGRLKSSCCLIDNRFTVKLADFGLQTLYKNIAVDKTSQEYLNGASFDRHSNGYLTKKKHECLWTAPEVLRGDVAMGTKAADMYSFGIVLQEIITRESPFYNETLEVTVPDILAKVIKGGNPPMRPSCEVPNSLTELHELMQGCWAEDPEGRPSFHAIRKDLKKILTESSGNLLDTLLRRMELYANNLEKLVEEKTQELREEKKRSEELLYQILPRSVAERLKRGLRVEPEAFECVTIYFSDICGFTNISARSSPMQVVDLLNDLYSCFDAVIDAYDVYKVETIGDAYMVVSGLPQRNGNKHAQQVALMSLALLRAIDTFRMRHLPDEKLNLRIGLHSGSVCAGVVGQKMPRYCLFGDTVNTASRMESHGQALKIHISDPTKQILDIFHTFNIEKRGDIEVKGKGLMSTYWLLSSCHSPHDTDGRSSASAQ
ncbi:atrial natriuretic peptide receptor 1-like [Haliotis asinina]|uniref:atrial natriuretic peptide receptor 1-like n=1 Tax=Haliotis asinina TaxID=109174 RepID=UPI0035320D0D